MKPPSLARRAASRFTYANVVASLALFIALGGVGYAAAKLPKNSVTSKAIKKNAVTNPKIKRSAVTSDKIKNGTIKGTDVANDTLTGAKINESTLSIPQAATAADSYNFVTTTSSSASNADENTARAAATPVPLISHGSVSIYAKCYTVTGAPDSTHFEVIASSTAGGSALSAYSVSDTVYDPALGPLTPETDRMISDDETDNANSVDDDYSSSVSLLGPDAKGLFFSTIHYARVGNPASPPGFLPSSGSCAFNVSGFKVG